MKIKIILSISVLGLLLYANTVSASNFVSDWYNTNITGKIEVPIQQGCSNTCWLLAAVTGLNQTEIGKAIISDTIKSDGNGGAIVTFKGSPNNHIPVSAIELVKFDSFDSTNKCTFSTGDADMRAIEIAAQKVYKSGDFPARLENDVIIGRIVSDLHFTFELLTGSDQSSWQYGTSWFGSFFLPDNVTRFSNSDINNLNNSDQYSTVSFTKDNIYATNLKYNEQEKLVPNNKHTYAITGSDDNFVYLFDSNYGNLKITRDNFLKAIPTVWTQKLDLTMILPKGDILSYLNEMGIPSDYELTDADYQEIADGYDYYEDPNTENNCAGEIISLPQTLEDPHCKGWSAIPSYSKNLAMFPGGIMSGDYLLINWNEAKAYCSSLGEGFRLPTMNEIWSARDLSWIDKDGGYNVCFDNLSHDRNSNYWTIEGLDVDSWNNSGRLVRCIH